MKIQVRYEEEYQTLEVTNEVLEKWLNVSIFEEESQEEYEERIQKEIEVLMNRPDYNNWHQHDRHSGSAVVKSKDGKTEINTDEAIMRRAKDKSVYTKDLDEVERRLDAEREYNYYCDYLRSVLKPKAADMVIAIVLDELSVNEYAELIGDTANNVSHRYRRAIKKLEKVFEKRPLNARAKATK